MLLHVLGSSSRGNGYILEAAQSALVIECGMPLVEVKRALRFDIGKVSGAVVSHRHSDHAGRVNDYLKAAISVCAPEDVFGAHGASRHPFAKSVLPMHRYKVGEFRVMPLEVIHDVQCFAYVIEHDEMGRLLFVTDTMMFRYRMNGLNHIMIEANYADAILDRNIDNGVTEASMRPRLLRSHMELKTTEAVLAATPLDDVGNIVLIHLSDRNSDPATFRSRIALQTGKAVAVARPNTTIELSNLPY